MIRGPDRTWIVPAILALLLAGSLTSVLSGSGEKLPLNVGFGRTSFLNVNVADAKVAFKVFTKKVGEAKGYDLEIFVRTFDSSDALQDAVTHGSLHLVIMPAWEYLSTDLHEYLEPMFLAVESGYGPREYLLLVREDAAYRHLSDLRGKKVLLLENTNCEMSGYWLQTLVLEEQSEHGTAFFNLMESVSKPTQALLPVFFGTADACVVSRPIFETMSELNPQLRRRLRSIVVSEPLIDSVTFVSYDGWAEPQYRSDMIEALDSLHRDPEGQQILTLFKSDRLKPFEEHYMDGTRALKAQHERLLEEMASK